MYTHNSVIENWKIFVNNKSDNEIHVFKVIPNTDVVLYNSTS